jgi:hypothetical protein
MITYFSQECSITNDQTGLKEYKHSKTRLASSQKRGLYLHNGLFTQTVIFSVGCDSRIRH